MNIIIITGASSGMGYEITKQIDSLYNDKLDEIWLISRSINKLDKLSNELKHQTRIYPTDLTNELDIETITNSLTILKPNILLLVNAAGYGIIGDFISSDIKEQAGMIRLNCEALTIMTSITLPYMKKGARILQFSSSAAFLPQPGFNVYSATKSYVLSFSRALNAELKSKKISVTTVCPGPVDTNFFITAEKYEKAKNFKRHFYAKPDDVAKKALYDCYKRKELSIYSMSMHIFHLLTKIIPHNLIIKISTLF